jgi:hypothetical protein
MGDEDRRPIIEREIRGWEGCRWVRGCGRGNFEDRRQLKEWEIGGRGEIVSGG